MSKNLEDQIRDALRRQNPPEGFAGRLLGQCALRSQAALRAETPRPRFHILWPAATVAATAALALSISIEYHSLQEQWAGRQAIQALQIASEKLNMARDKILHQ
jgi:hypothetical protein